MWVKMSSSLSLTPLTRLFWTLTWRFLRRKKRNLKTRASEFLQQHTENPLRLKVNRMKSRWKCRRLWANCLTPRNSRLPLWPFLRFCVRSCPRTWEWIWPCRRSSTWRWYCGASRVSRRLCRASTRIWSGLSTCYSRCRRSSWETHRSRSGKTFLASRISTWFTGDSRRSPTGWWSCSLKRSKRSSTSSRSPLRRRRMRMRL